MDDRFNVNPIVYQISLLSIPFDADSKARLFCIQDRNVEYEDLTLTPWNGRHVFLTHFFWRLEIALEINHIRNGTT